MTGAFDDLLADIRSCTLCAADLPLGPRPVVRGRPGARILIIGQAPGTRVHASGIPWDDRSGERLREWLDVTADVFYDEERIAIMPMGFCYPGRAAAGGDLPPRPECAPQWHQALRRQLVGVELTLLVGSYAQKYYLGEKACKTMTETVRAWSDYGPAVLSTPHPSWRTVGWQRKNPWFEAQLLPDLQRRVRGLL
ncbi:MAG: uracil-DNA glycosylase family protein [Rhodospirillales bacterium]|nr:uracil-DNA glycosylase family protein [Rhodospirillales bacterium]